MQSSQSAASVYSKATFHILTLTRINVQQLSNTGNKQIHIGCPHVTLPRQHCFALTLPVFSDQRCDEHCLPAQIHIIFHGNILNSHSQAL